jgi:hypothetical protein
MEIELTPRKVITKASLGGMKFLYNPNTIQDVDSITYNDLRTAGISYPVLVYGGGESRVISFDVYLNDKVEAGITKKFITNLEKYLPPRRKSGYQFVPPPKIQFAFGWMVLDCYLYSLQKNYTAFSPKLEPIEATLNVSLKVIQ